MSYFVGRLSQSLVTLLVISALIFFAVRASGNVVNMMAPIDANAAQIARIRAEVGLDKPIPVQFWRYVTRSIRGDFGNSFRSREPARDLVFARLPATAELAAVALSIACGVGVPIGVASASRRGSLLDGVGRIIALFGQAVPQFWAAIVLILVFSVNLRWFPSGGRNGLSSVVLPAVALGWYSAASIMRITRSAMLDSLSEDYVIFARARGLSERRIVWRHALRNASLPIITLMGVQLGYLLGGAVAIETVFAWPGIGKLMIDSIFARDYAVVQAAVLVSGVIFVSLNFCIDMAYLWIDPRIRVR